MCGFVEVHTTRDVECVDATEVSRPNGGGTSTCEAIFQRNPASCEGRLADLCPVTCGLCDDMTTMEPSEPAEDTTEEPFECSDFRLEPSNDCPWPWEIQSDCNAVGEGERCEPEQSYPEYGLNDWEIGNCGSNHHLTELVLF